MMNFWGTADSWILGVLWVDFHSTCLEDFGEVEKIYKNAF